MKNLKIHNIESKGDISKECIWLDVLEDMNDLDHYILCDKTFTNSNETSNELRHMYWFPKKILKKGDWIKLSTGPGTDGTFSNSRKTTTHCFYWKLGKTVWNKDGDVATLFHINEWVTKKV